MWDPQTMEAEPADLIDVDPTVVHGQARIRRTRIPVTVVLDCLATGMTEEQIRAQYPSLPTGAVNAALSRPVRKPRAFYRQIPLFRSYMELRGRSSSSMQVAD